MPFVAAAGCVWLGVPLGAWSWWWLPSSLCVAVLLGLGRSWFLCGCAIVMAVGVGSGIMLADRTASAGGALPDGPVVLLVEVVRDGSSGRWNGAAEVVPVAIKHGNEYVAWDGPRGRLRGEHLEDWKRGTRWEVTTTMRVATGIAPWTSVVWNGTARQVQPSGVEESLLEEGARRARSRIVQELDTSRSQGRALLAGFLIGDVSELTDVSNEHMRRAGLSHYVAVSGSNVALFLAVLFVVAGPLGWGARRRSIIGVCGLAFFVTLIGPDPSVIRAAAMAAIVLIAQAFSLRPSIWTVMGAGVTVLLLVAPELAFALGFQLSVAATAGVVAGARLFPNIRPRWIGATLGASVAAQVAVAPILLASVGSVPLWSPAANVIAAPFVMAATSLGGVGTILGIDLLIGMAAATARIVLGIASVASPLPQLDAGGVVVVVAVVGVVAVKRVRPLATVVAAAMLAVSSVPWTGATAGPALIALDVGQGDAVLLIGTRGETVLVDGGPSGIELLDGLDRHGIRSVDLLIVTHAHRDHYGGLDDLIDRVSVGVMWYVPSPTQSQDFERFVAAASQRTMVVTPSVGSHRVGSIQLGVIGPTRRYSSVNDQSIVVVATYASTTVLLTGDIEEVAQADIPPPSVSIIKIPHHGSATSNLGWLVDTGALVAIVSVGENAFGHPAPDIVSGLEDSGMVVHRTDLEGDVVVPLVGPP